MVVVVVVVVCHLDLTWNFPLKKTVEKSEKPEKSFPLGCTRNLGLGFTLFKKSLKKVKNLKNLFH